VRHPSGAMPPYTSKVASDADLNDIRAYLESMPAPPPLKSVPILNQ
jgi:cytochrome c553